MPNPTQGSLHVDSLLTNMSLGYSNLMYIADDIFPIVTVEKQSDIIPEYEQSHWFRDEAQLRAPGTKSRRGGFKVLTNRTYFCHRFSYGFEVADEVRDNTDQPFNLERDAVEYVTDKLFLRRERAFASDFFTTGVWGSDKTGGTDFTQWSNYGSSDPLVDLTGYQDDIEASVGVEANTLVLGKQVWLQLKWHPVLIDTIKHVQRGVITQEIFQSLLDGIGRILIGRAIVTTTAEGTAEASVTYSRVWGKHGLLLYVPERPSLMRPAAGYTFVWRRVPNALQYMVRHRDDQAELDIIEANSYFDQKSLITNSGIFLSSAVA